MTCSHPRLYVGLDHSYCPDCGKSYVQLGIPLSPVPAMPSPSPTPPFAETAQPSANDQIPLFAETENLFAETSRSTSANTELPLRQKIYHCPSHARKYYKYVCWRGQKIIHQVWIPGGDINNRIAQSRAIEVERWITRGMNPDEIARRIKQWPAKRRKR